MEIICLTVGDLATHCYLVTDPETSETLIVDPGDEGDFISTTILEQKLTPKAVLLTHGHYDHCLATLELKLNFNLPIYLHQKDLFLYEKAHLSAKHFSGITIPKLPPIDHFLEDRNQIKFGNSTLQVIHTPGHTPGSICLFSCTEHQQLRTSHLFSGDTLFVSGVGSTDHSYSSQSQIRHSIKNLSLVVPNFKSTPIYPGHEDFGLPPSRFNK